jgi:hypothetical protein
MIPNNAEETTRLIPVPVHDIPRSVRDNRQPYQKQLAVYFILASVLFERIAFYALVANLSVTLKSIGWSYRHSATASYIFSGK